MLKSISKMPTKFDVKGMFMGAMVADAASVNCHWVYPFMKEAFESFTAAHEGKPEFMKQVYNPFYRGQPSPYGDQVMALMYSMTSCNGWNMQHYKDTIYKYFGPGTRYSNKTPVENPIAGKPVQGGHSNHSTEDFVEAYTKEGPNTENGARKDDKQADGMVKAFVMAAYYMGKPEFYQYCKECVEVTQDAPDATYTTLAVARFMEAVYNNKFDYETVMAFAKGMEGYYTPQNEMVDTTMKSVVECEEEDHFEFAKKTGINCRVPAAFAICMHNFAQQFKNFPDQSPQDMYIQVLRKNMAIGGCNCSRSIVMGAIMGGVHGMSAVPTSWIEQTENADQVMKFAEVAESQTTQQ